MSSSSSLDLNYSTFNPIKQRKKSHLVAGFLLTVVVLLHMTLAWYLLHMPKKELKKPPVVMEVEMLIKPDTMLKQVAKEPRPAPQPVKKEPIKPNPVAKPLKKPVVVNKPAPAVKPEPAEIKELMPVPKYEPTPTLTPSPPVVAPAPVVAPSASSSLNSSAKTTGHVSNEDKTVVSSVVPLLRVPPKYPVRAASRHIEGWVTVEFTIQTDGSVADAVVVGSDPETIFDDAALTAIGKWKFKEKIVNGVAVPQRALQRLQFKLEQ